jgi:homocysteine S-methyltransferase
VVAKLADALAAGAVLLDGGLATELEARGHDLSSALWSARLLADDPDAVVRAHSAYFAAGAQVATTASYQASLDGFGALGLDRRSSARLIASSVALAARARDGLVDGRDRWIAGSVGPYGAALADGSEYRGVYDRSVRELRAWHRPRLELLIGAGADVLALETIPCLAEVEALLTEVAGLDLPCWLSVTCAGDRTRAGERAAEAFAMAREVPEVIAVGANCIAPEDAPSLVRAAAAAAGKPVVIYPNRGETWDARTRSWLGPGREVAPDVTEWVRDGARLVGGCCRVGPAQIAGMADALGR